MFETLFAQQNQIYEYVLEDISNENNRIALFGNSGCGKTTLTEHLIYSIISSSDEWMVFNFAGDEYCVEKDYFPLISGLDNYCQKYNISKLIKKTIPKLLDDGSEKGTVLSYVLDTILNRKVENELYINNIFSEEEIDILYKIKSCISSKRCLFYLDNLHWWDSKSLHFFYLLLKYSDTYLKELKNAIIICNITMDQVKPYEKKVNSLMSDFNFRRYYFEKLTQDEYSKCLKDMGFYIEENISKLLYKLTNQNFAITRAALSSPSTYTNLSTEIRTDETKFLKILVEMRLTELGATGEQITEVLKYASLIGYAFSLKELEYLVPYNDNEVIQIIHKANSLYLIEPEQMLYHFTHEIIREFFRKKLEADNFTYLQKTIDCLKLLHPYDYATRIGYLLKIGDVCELEKIYGLKLIDQLEKTGSCEQNYELNIIVSDDARNFYDNIISAYIAFQSGNYTNAITFLKCIEDIYCFEFLSTRDILLSQCLTKSISKSSREQAVSILERYLENGKQFTEKQIWASTMQCLLTAYIHIRDISSAQVVLDKLYEFYSKNSKICSDYKKELNIMRRKCTPFYELEVATIYLRKSVSFFSPSQNDYFILYPRQYFMSLINYSSNQICMGEFLTGFDSAQIALNLYNQMPGMRFPRLEIAMNNYLLSGFLSKKMSISDTITSFCALLQNLEEVADKVLIQTNLSALYLMNFQKDKAFSLLSILNTDIEKSKCKEFSYIYHVKTNLLIIAILEHNWQKAETIARELEEIIPNLYQNFFFAEKHRLLTQFVSHHKEIAYDDSFTTILLNEISSLNSAWKYYGLLPAFDTLEYWSEP